MRRDRAVVDDAPALGLLFLHHAKGVLRAQEGAGQVHRDDIRPLLIGQILERNAARTDPGVVEQQVDAAISLFDHIEKSGDRGRIGDVGRHDKAARRRSFRQCGGLLEHCAAPPGQYDREALLQQGEGRGTADAAAGPGDDGDPVWCCHCSRPLQLLQ
jgi:hypothetical protein